MKSFTDKLTKEKIYEYRVDDSGDFADAQSEASGKDVKIIVNMRKCGNVFRRGLNVKSAEGNFASINLGYPHCFKCIDKTGAEHDYVFGLNAENKLAFYDFTSAGTFVGALSDVTLTKPPILIDYNYDGQNYLLINCGEKGFYVYDNEFTKLGANPLVTERLFTTESFLPVRPTIIRGCDTAPCSIQKPGAARRRRCTYTTNAEWCGGL